MGVSSTLIVGVLVFLLVKYFKSILAFVKFRNAMETIGGMKAHWISGNMYRKRNEEDLYNQIDSMSQFPKFQRRWMGMFHGGIAFCDPKLSHNVLSKFTGKSRIYTAIENVFGDGLLTNKGDKWKHYRRLLNPAFHSEMMKLYMHIFNSAALRLVARLKENGDFCVHDECSRMGLEAMTEAIFSENTITDEQRENYFEATDTLRIVFGEILKAPYLINKWIFSKSKYKKPMDHSLSVMSQVALQSIKGCKKNRDKNFEPKRMLEILTTSNNENGTPMTDEEIIVQLNTFMFAGHETTAGALGWSLYCLAINQQCQEKCREEIENVLKDNHNVGWEDLSKLEYLTMCINESMRLYSSAFICSRKLEKQTIVNELLGEGYKDMTLPPGTILWVDIAAMHRNPKVWNDPDTFDPLRFTAENIAKREANSYIPFASGKRNCIGQNFAMTELKVALSLLLKSFKFSLHENFPKPKIELYITLRQDGDFMLKATPCD